MNRHAPAVHLDATPDRRWRQVRQACSLVVLIGCTCWSVSTPHPTPAWPAWGVALAAGITSWLAWPGVRAPTRSLHWDGTQWRVDEQPCQVAITIDVGRWLLLRIVHDRRPPQWIALSQRDHTAVWHALRCALYCGRPPPPTQNAGADAVPPP